MGEVVCEDVNIPLVAGGPHHPHLVWEEAGESFHRELRPWPHELGVVIDTVQIVGPCGVTVVAVSDRGGSGGSE
jgi:hypothetical protein